MPYHHSSSFNGFWSRSASTTNWHFLTIRSRPPRLLTTSVLNCYYITTTDCWGHLWLHTLPYQSHDRDQQVCILGISTIWNSLLNDNILVTFKHRLKMILLNCIFNSDTTVPSGFECNGRIMVVRELYCITTLKSPQNSCRGYKQSVIARIYRLGEF